MQIQNSKERKYQLSILKASLLSGVAGCFGVLCQTVSLLWHFNIQHEKIRAGLSFKQTAMHIYHTGGVFRFYKGFMPSFRSASMARFGDNTLNTLVMRELNRNINLKHMSIFIKSAIVWIFAGTWRLAMMPILALENSSQGLFERSLNKGTILRSIRRIYIKRTKPEILSLYSWFTFHNYCDSYSSPLKYRDNLQFFIMRHAMVGFGSMVCYDLFLMAYRKIKHVKGINSGYNVLLGDCQSRIFLKGMHGAVFCTTSNLFKLFAIKAISPKH